MELNGFVIGPEIKKLFKIKVGTVFVEHPVHLFGRRKQTSSSNQTEAMKMHCLSSSLARLMSSEWIIRLRFALTLEERKLLNVVCYANPIRNVSAKSTPRKDILG